MVRVSTIPVASSHTHTHARTHISILFKSFELAKGILSEEARVLSTKCEIFPEVVIHCV